MRNITTSGGVTDTSVTDDGHDREASGVGVHQRRWTMPR